MRTIGEMRIVVGIVSLAVVIGLSSILTASNAPANTTPQDVFNGMRQSFQAQKAKGVHLKYQWQLSGPQGGEWWIEVNDGTYKMGKGKIPDPNVTFIAKDKDWVAICHDQLSGTWAYLTGRLKVRGIMHSWLSPGFWRGVDGRSTMPKRSIE